METKEILNEVIGYLNRNYYQDSENYDIFNGAKPDVFLYNKNTAVALWSCGAIVCIGSLLYFIGEDDGNWFLTHNGMQNTFSIGWSESFRNAMQRLEEFVKEHGHPVCFSGTDTICHYSL